MGLIKPGIEQTFTQREPSTAVAALCNHFEVGDTDQMQMWLKGEYLRLAGDPRVIVRPNPPLVGQMHEQQGGIWSLCN